MNNTSLNTTAQYGITPYKVANDRVENDRLANDRLANDRLANDRLAKETATKNAGINTIVEHFVAEQDPILGIKPSNRVDRLDSNNWQSKALFLKQEQSIHYIYLNQTAVVNARRKQRNYCVNIYDISKRSVVSQVIFSTIREALVFANQGRVVDQIRTG